MAVDEPGGAGYAPLGVGEIYLGYGWIFLLGGLGESDELFPSPTLLIFPLTEDIQ